LVVIHLDLSKFLRLRRNLGFPSPTKVDLQATDTDVRVLTAF